MNSSAPRVRDASAQFGIFDADRTLYLTARRWLAEQAKEKRLRQWRKAKAQAVAILSKPLA